MNIWSIMEKLSTICTFITKRVVTSIFQNHNAVRPSTRFVIIITLCYNLKNLFHITHLKSMYTVYVTEIWWYTIWIPKIFCVKSWLCVVIWSLDDTIHMSIMPFEHFEYHPECLLQFVILLQNGAQCTIVNVMRNSTRFVIIVTICNFITKRVVTSISQCNTTLNPFCNNYFNLL